MADLFLSAVRAGTVQSTDAQLATVVVEMALQAYLLLAVAVEMACLLWACDWYPAYR
jgi:hypothetical protein